MFDPRVENTKRMARRRFESRAMVDRIKSGRPCADCGKKYRPCQMDVLGREGGREVPMARMLHLSKDRIIAEVGRSDIVCANCSRLRTWKREREKRRGPT